MSGLCAVIVPSFPFQWVRFGVGAVGFVGVGTRTRWTCWRGENLDAGGGKLWTVPAVVGRTFLNEASE